MEKNIRHKKFLGLGQCFENILPFPFPSDFFIQENLLWFYIRGDTGLYREKRGGTTNHPPPPPKNHDPKPNGRCCTREREKGEKERKTRHEFSREI